ncbi:MAG TPA: indole-3-glycerol-phosphate synthase TrpC [Actinobacteria bacterium]|nr:indole-3-glycerol-phosphate synthase TrpC [Actinomycetota bacterium]
MVSKFLKDILVAKKKGLKDIKLSGPADRSDLNRKGFINNISPGRINIIAEIKKASPSRGIINGDLDVAEAAAIYNKYRSFISGLSVLTEELYFKGKKTDIALAKTGTALPVLRKDFIISKKQVYESAELGADCILLISSLLSYDKLKKLYKCAMGIGIDVLVETHYRQELIHALDMGAEMIGINNRDLKKMRVDSSHIMDLLEDIPSDDLEGKIIICESGVDSSEYIERLYGMGVNTFLIGTHFMKSREPDNTLSEFENELKRRNLI